MSTIIQTNDGSQYRKPSYLRTQCAITAAMAAQTLPTIALIPLSNSAMYNMRRASESSNAVTLINAAKKALDVSGMKQKGVKLFNFNPKESLRPSDIIKDFSKFIENLCNKPINPKKRLKPFSLLNNYMVRTIRHGYNAGFKPDSNAVYINMKKMGLSVFHEIGHSINFNSSKFWRGMQKMRMPLMILASALPLVAMFKRKKAEGEESKGFVDKTTTFIKNNVGKLTTLAFVPVVAEEIMASVRGNAMAKKLLSAELAKKVAKSNMYGAFTYIALGIFSGVGAYLANKVRDSIAKPQKIN